MCCRHKGARPLWEARNVAATHKLLAHEEGCFASRAMRSIHVLMAGAPQAIPWMHMAALLVHRRGSGLLGFLGFSDNPGHVEVWHDASSAPHPAPGGRRAQGHPVDARGASAVRSRFMGEHGPARAGRADVAYQLGVRCSRTLSRTAQEVRGRHVQKPWEAHSNMQ